ncbi:MAG TPA: mechanosensitive ion channel family protein [Spirochaetia bacterium]|nr:mechanosensitive ion channel family protein [Spirochaetia bacterium]
MFFQQVSAWLHSLSPDVLSRALRIVLTLVIGLFLVRVLAVVVQRYIMRKSTPQRQMIARKAIGYSGFVLVLVAVLGELGVKLTALLGAAGIVGIAVGIASQTSVSNIIGGLFLISEKPFGIGDVIRTGTTTGIIQSIDLLSIKIRTFDNLFVRIPNEKIISSEVVNLTRFPIRRMDLLFQIAYGEDLSGVQDLLEHIARGNPWSLDEPNPVIVFNDFKENGIEVLFGLWFSQPDFVELKNSIMKDITTRFAAAGISFASPHRTIRIVEGSIS